MESRGGVPGAQWCAANCRKVFGGKSREIAASQVSSLEPLGPRESLDCQFPPFAEGFELQCCATVVSMLMLIACAWHANSRALPSSI